MRGFDGKPLADTDCILTVERASVTVHTKADGLLELDVPAHAQEATLEAGGQQWTLKIGHLDPVDTDAGLWARLRNLGYLVDEVSGGDEPAPDAPPDPDALRFAVELFQRDAKLAIDGDDLTSVRDKLRSSMAADSGALHAPRRSLPVLVAPTLDGETNTLRSPTCRSPAGASRRRASTSTRR